jgi:hypothetical protein
VSVSLHSCGFLLPLSYFLWSLFCSFPYVHSPFSSHLSSVFISCCMLIASSESGRWRLLARWPGLCSRKEETLLGHAQSPVVLHRGQSGRAVGLTTHCHPVQTLKCLELCLHAPILTHIWELHSFIRLICTFRVGFPSERFQSRNAWPAIPISVPQTRQADGYFLLISILFRILLWYLSQCRSQIPLLFHISTFQSLTGRLPSLRIFDIILT